MIGGGLKKGKHRTVQLIDMDKGTYHSGELLIRILTFFTKFDLVLRKKIIRHFYLRLLPEGAPLQDPTDGGRPVE